MPALRDISVVIPAGPRERAWPPLLGALDDFGEVVLSCALGGDLPAVPPRVRVVAAPAGRARQLNAGIAASTRPWLLLLHADSRFDGRAPNALRAAPDGAYIGYFDLRFSGGPALMRLTAVGVWLRSRLLGLPFGDQGMLIRRDVLAQLGQFDERVEVGEDHALVWAGRRAGIPARPLRAPLWTSPRKYQELGWWRVTRAHAALTWSQARTWSRAPR